MDLVSAVFTNGVEIAWVHLTGDINFIGVG